MKISSYNQVVKINTLHKAHEIRKKLLLHHTIFLLQYSQLHSFLSNTVQHFEMGEKYIRKWFQFLKVQQVQFNMLMMENEWVLKLTFAALSRKEFEFLIDCRRTRQFDAILVGARGFEPPTT